VRNAGFPREAAHDGSAPRRRQGRGDLREANGHEAAEPDDEALELTAAVGHPAGRRARAHEQRPASDTEHGDRRGSTRLESKLIVAGANRSARASRWQSWPACSVNSTPDRRPRPNPARPASTRPGARHAGGAAPTSSSAPRGTTAWRLTTADQRTKHRPVPRGSFGGPGGRAADHYVTKGKVVASCRRSTPAR